MGQTMLDTIREALIKESIQQGSLELLEESLEISPETFRRMWKKITGKKITLDEAMVLIKKGSHANS